MSLEKKFVIKHDFEDVMDLKAEIGGKVENHHSTSWNLYANWDDSSYMSKLCLFLECLKPRGKDEWSIKTNVVLEYGKNNICYSDHTFSNNSDNKIMCVAINSCDVEDNLVYNNLEVRCHVAIEKVIGFGEERLRSFDESVKKFSDVVLVVEDQKFHVSKLFLASQCTYFESLLLGNFEESEKTEIELKDIDPYDFQKFLEVLYGEPAIDDDTVEGILQLADMYDSKTVIRKCEEFLINGSMKSLNNKFHLAAKYNFEKITKKCMAEMKNVTDLRSIDPEYFPQFTGKVWLELFKKSLSFSNQ